MSENRQIFSLRQVVSSIRKTIEERYQSTYWVKAEMHKLNLYPSGHAFPELVQKEDGKIVAQINGSIWKHNLQRINQQFVSVVKEPLKEGNTLLLQVKIAYHETFGMSLQILDIDPNYSLGELQRERQETLLRLKQEGLLNRNQEVDFPLLPQRIAIISADTSKGLSDFMKVLDQNPWGYAFFSMLFPAYLQGDVAVESIIEQLRRIETVKSHFDVVVIVRGGGGEVGMSCYNHFDLCKAIASFPLPVLTGIGHSTNLTVAEMIAYRNAITPTELGEFLLQSFHEFSVPVRTASESIVKASKNLLERTRMRFENETRAFRANARQNINAQRNDLLRVSQKLRAKTDLTIDRQRERIQYSGKELLAKTKRFFTEQHGQLSEATASLSQHSLKFTDLSSQKLEQLERHIRLLDPQHVLRRGYSITRFQGRSVTAENPVSESDQVEIETLDFTLVSKVEKVIPHNNSKKSTR